MYIKVLACEKKNSGYSFVKPAFAMCSLYRERNIILLGFFSEVQDYTGIQDGSQHIFEDLYIRDGETPPSTLVNSHLRHARVNGFWMKTGYTAAWFRHKLYPVFFVPIMAFLHKA